ncbi:MAG: tetratricopeptide repeat protein, partial [Bacteroidia bacterium]
MNKSFILLILFISIFSNCFSQTYEELILKGSQNFEIRNYSVALNDFTKAIILDSTIAIGYYNRALVKNEMHD